MGKSIMFTGHRPAGLGFVKSEIGYNGKPRFVNAYNRNSYEAFIDQLAAVLEPKVQEGYDTFLTGGAQGMDMLAFWAVEKLKAKGFPVRNILCVPFRDYGSQWARYGTFSRTDALHIMQTADEVRIVKEGDLDDRARIGALMERNHYMADAADLCVALLRTDKNARGGTAECVRYCERKSVPVIYLDTCIIEENGLEKLIITGTR